MDASAVQPSKAEPPMDVTDDGSDTSSSAASPLQAESGPGEPVGEGGPPDGAARQGAAAVVAGRAQARREGRSP